MLGYKQGSVALKLLNQTTLVVHLDILNSNPSKIMYSLDSMIEQDSRKSCLKVSKILQKN